MKNNRIEQYKQSAKRYKYPTHAHIKDGVRIYHDYSEPREKTFWDDCGFKINGVYHLILFVHPRHAYYDHCNDIASDRAEKLLPIEKPSFFENSVPVKKKVGRGNRVKIEYYRSSPDFNFDPDFYKNWEQFKYEELKGSYEQKCFMQVFQKDYCKQIEVCFPFEIYSEYELIELVQKIKKYLKEPGSFNTEWNNYSYTTQQWFEEFGENNG